MKLEIRWVEDLIALEAEGSISKAAESRCVSQSSFTRRVQHLEDLLGFAVLNRDTKHVSFTDAGKVLLKTSKRIREQLKNTLNVLHEQQLEKQDSIKICISHSLLANFFPNFIRTLPENMQQTSYEIISVNLWEGLKKLMQGGCHFFICYGDQDLIRSLNPEVLTYMKLEDIQIVPVSLNEDSAPKYHIHRPFPLLAYGRETFLKGFVDEKVKGLNYKKLYEADNAQDLRELVLQGLGIAWLPYAIVEQDILLGKLVQFDEQYSFHNQIYIIKNKISDPENVNIFWDQLLCTL